MGSPIDKRRLCGVRRGTVGYTVCDSPQRRGYSMPSLDSTEVARALRRKLGCYEERTGDHVYYYVRDADGALLSYTKLSHGGRYTIGPGLVAQMAKQLAFPTINDFVNLVRCPLEGAQALVLIRQASGTERK